MKTTYSVSSDQLQQLRELLDSRCGIWLGDATHHFVGDGVARLMAQLRVETFDEFYQQAADPTAGLRDRLLNAMISRETAWFRDPESLTVLVEEILPEFEEQLACGGAEKLRIWSAGCATGQEPYSLVMSLLERQRREDQAGELPDHFEIIGTDISPAALFIAVAGRYERTAVAKGLPSGYLERYFQRGEFAYCLREPVRQAVRFRQRNVLNSVEGLVSGRFDIVLMRHVLEYYTDSTKDALLTNIAAGIVPGGVLMLGRHESLRENTMFEPMNIPGCACYRRV